MTHVLVVVRQSYKFPAVQAFSAIVYNGKSRAFQVSLLNRNIFRLVGLLSGKFACTLFQKTHEKRLFLKCYTAYSLQFVV